MAERLGPERVARLVEEYQEGSSVLALSKRYGCAKASVLKILKDGAVAPDRRA